MGRKHNGYRSRPCTKRDTPSVEKSTVHILNGDLDSFVASCLSRDYADVTDKIENRNVRVTHSHILEGIDLPWNSHQQEQKNEQGETDRKSTRLNSSHVAI